MKICYLNNQYPKVSHTFIRREILALESLGQSVLRVCARQSAEGLVDPADITEAKITQSIAQGVIVKVLIATIVQLFSNPLVFARALFKSLRLGMRDNLQVHKYIIYLAEASYLKKLCIENQIEHVHAHFGTNPTAVAMLCKLLGGPDYSFTVHGPEEFDRPIALSLGDKIHHAKFVVAISFFCQSQLYRWCQSLTEWQKITIVRCALNENLFQNTVAIAESSKRLLAIGRLSEQKGFPILLEAAARLQSDGIEFQLDIVGDGPMRGEMENFIRNEHLQGKVNILGYKSGEDIKSLLDQSCCLLVPSFAEGLPVVIMEALARKRPVVTTQIAAMSELVEHSASGWIVPPGDVDSLAQTITKVLATDVSILNAMGEVGWLKVAQQHNSQREAEKLVQRFKQ